MKVKFNSRVALLYQGENFTQNEKLEEILKAARTELRAVQPEALDLTLAALVGYVNTPPATLPFTGLAPKDSCLVLAGMQQEVLDRLLERIREAELAISHKAVMTGENRNWAFGALVNEMQKEKAQQQSNEAENDKKEGKEEK